ncbi:MAG: 2-dehydropantoate 2-reductase [Dehalococcoidia bacterium]|nr:2-dehydropantoate 2-reductase [Dehalococcoidia bacterium]
MRYIIYGAGAIGGVIGALLHLSGQEVTLIARGAHLKALQENGLTFISGEGTQSLAIPSVGSPAELELTPEDVVFLAMKSQDTVPAIDTLFAAAPPTITVVCAQNGVVNERMALRRFPNVYGQLVILPGTHLEPGTVIASASPVHGILDLGRYPSGSDERAETIARDLTEAQFSSVARQDIMPWKYGKLLRNLANSLQAILGLEQKAETLIALAREEAISCFKAAGVEVVDDQLFNQRFQALNRIVSDSSAARSGNSSWQSLARGATTIEAAYLNGEVALLGRLHGVPTPVNALLQKVATEVAVSGQGPGAFTVANLEERLP